MAIFHSSAILILPYLIAFTTFPEHYCISVPFSLILYLLGYGLTSYFSHLFSLKSSMLPASILAFLISHTFQQQISLIISGQSNPLEVLWILLSWLLPVGMYWRRQWHPTPVLLPGKSNGQRSLVGCSPWGRQELDTTEWLHFHFSLSYIGEGNGSPLQCSCLENPRDGGAGGLPSMGSHTVGHDWSDLAAA